MKVSVGEQKFRGEMPRAEPCLLPNNFAQAAELTKLISGDIEPWRGPLVIDPNTGESGGGGGNQTMPKARNPGTLRFTEDVYESSGTVATLYVERVNGSTGIVSCDYATADDTAIAGTDYTAKTGTVTFADGDTTPKPITIVVNPIAQTPLIRPWGTGDYPLVMGNSYKFQIAIGGNTGFLTGLIGTLHGPAGTSSYYNTIDEAIDALEVESSAGITAYRGWGNYPKGPPLFTPGTGASYFSSRYPNGPPDPVSQTTIYLYYNELNSPYSGDYARSGYSWFDYWNSIGNPLNIPFPFVSQSGSATTYVESMLVMTHYPAPYLGYSNTDSVISVTRVAQPPPPLEFTVSLSNPVGEAVIGTPGTATVEIIVP